LPAPSVPAKTRQPDPSLDARDQSAAVMQVSDAKRSSSSSKQSELNFTDDQLATVSNRSMRSSMHSSIPPAKTSSMQLQRDAASHTASA
jgi:hypothetical protein